MPRYIVSTRAWQRMEGAYSVFAASAENARALTLDALAAGRRVPGECLGWDPDYEAPYRDLEVTDIEEDLDDGVE